MQDHYCQNSTSHGAEILVVDDHREITDMLAEALCDEGYTVRVANDGFTALQSIQRHTPDLLIVDVAMPMMRGDQLVRQLRSNGANDLPIILMTADRTPEHYAGLGVNELVRKPFDIGSLLCSVALYVRQSVAVGVPRLRPRLVERDMGA
jgi:DNA-binding response OmpR family regulator